MGKRDTYSRRISPEEEHEGYILVLKGALSFFPPVGARFSLRDDGLCRTARVESYPCTCRGPELPHEHYLIRWRGLKAGDRVEIRKDLKKQGTYAIAFLKRD